MPQTTLPITCAGDTAGTYATKWEGSQVALNAMLTELYGHIPLIGAATLDFPSIAAAGQQDLTIAVTGAVVGKAVTASPSTTLEAGLVPFAFVSATDVVTVRLSNITAGAIDPASRPWTVAVAR